MKDLFMAIENPKVFLSYAWTDNEFRNRVIELAERLIANRVNVLLDVWDLADGGDKFQYMEQAVADKEVTKVLIICNKKYKEKAETREGGVGHETTIITPALFSNKSAIPKFIPILFEQSENSDDIVPASLASKIYIDMSDKYTFEENFERLLRTIYGEPEFVKPTLGSLPAFVVNQPNANPSLSTLISFRNRMGCINDNSQHIKTRAIYFKYRDAFIEAIKQYEITEIYPNIDPEYLAAQAILEKMQQMLPLRNEYCNFLSIVIENNLVSDIDFSELFEMVNNEVINVLASTQSTRLTEHFGNFLWEMIISTTVYCFYYQVYDVINSYVKRTYYLQHPDFSQEWIEEQTIANLKPNEFFIQKYFKHLALNINNENTYKLSYTAIQMLEREYLPILSRSSIINADMLIYWLTSLNLSDQYPWFPMTYGYTGNSNDHFVKKFKSKSYCMSILPLFGVDSIENLKVLIKEHPLERGIRYQGGSGCPADTYRYLVNDDIGTLP
jgi:hypothetical protein